MPEKSPDPRLGAGRPVYHLEMPTNLIPSHCMCSWQVIKPGPGLACLSVLAYANALCPIRHKEAAAAAAGKVA